MYTGFVPQSTSIGGVGLGDGQALLVPKPSSSGTFWFSDGSGLTTSPIDSAWAILGASLGNGKIVFFSSPHQLAVTDGTVAGTQIVDPTLPSASTAYKGRFGIAGLGDGRALVGLGGSDVGSLYLTDGTAAGTTLLADGPFGSMMYSNAGYFCNLAVLGGGRFVFEDGTGGLWGSDGTAAGTAPLGISVKPSTATPNVAALSDGRAVVLTSDNQAWVTDGTVAGTALLASLPGSVVLHSVNSLGEGKMVFACADAAGTGTELWVSDGSAAGTHILKDINPGTADAFTALTIAVTGDGKAVFLADDGIHGTETWVTDGTSAGTTLLKDVNAGADTGASQVFASRTQIVMDAGNGGTFTGGGGAVKIAPAAWVSDSGNTVRRYWYNPIISSSITGMSVTLAAAPDGAAESLSLVGQDPAISASYDAASRTLTLTGTADALTYQQALRLVTYNNTAAATLTGTSRSFTITATDPLVSVHVSGALSVARAAGGGTGTGGTGTGNTGGTGSGVTSNHAAPAPSTGTSTQGSSPPAAVVQTVMADPAPALQSVFQAIRAPGNTFGVNDSAGPGSATGIFAFTQGPATPTTVAAPVAVDTRTAAPTFQVAVAPKTAGAADSLVINAPMRDSTVAEGTRIVVTIPTDAFAATRLDVAVSLTATQADGGALPGWMTFNPQTGTFEGTPPLGFKGEVVVRVVARDQDGHEAVQTFKITVGEADQGQAAPTDENGRPQEQGPGDGPPQDEPPARQGDVGGHARVATAQPVGKPSLTEQLRAQSMNGRLAKHAALFEVLKTSGKAA
jgi:ELWxxDGT repeat protein